jgi:hypothetical protein
MKMLHPTLMHEVAKERRRDLLRAAEANRLAWQAFPGQPTIYERLLSNIRGLWASDDPTLRNASQDELALCYEDMVCA